METWQIILLAGAFLSWAGWVSITAIRTERKAEKSLSNDAANEKELDSIIKKWDSFENKFDAMEKMFQNEFTKTNNRLDIFINQELQTLKQIAQK
jgi:hypothetical protein